MNYDVFADEFRMVLGGQTTPCFLQQNSQKAIFYLAHAGVLR